MRRDAFIAACQRMGAQLLYAPSLAEAGQLIVPDLSGFGRDGSAKSGASIGAGLIDGGAAAILDGVNDYIDSGWATRTNKVLNPNFELGTAKWGGQGEGVTIARSTADHVDGTACLEVSTPGKSSAEGAISNSFPVVAGRTYQVSFYIKSTVAGKSQRIMAKLTGEAFATTVFTSSTEWQRVSVSFTAEVGQTESHIEFRNLSSTVLVALIDCVMCEESAVLGSYFPTVAQLESGEAGWSGAAGESASQIGPLANGTKRTFAGISQRSGETTRDVLIGGLNAPTARFILAVEASSKQVTLWLRSLSTSASWPGAWPGTGVPVSWAVTIDQIAGTAELFINGVSQGVKTFTAEYDATQTLAIGTDAVAPFEGTVLPFAVFPTALGAAELALLAATAGLAPKPLPQPRYALR